MHDNFGIVGGLGVTELSIILVIILLLFGSKKLPELSRSVGESLREIKGGLNNDNSQKSQKTDERDQHHN